MSYASTSSSPFAALASVIQRAVTALASVSDSIVADRRHAAAHLEAKSDEELARMGLSRARIAQDVHQHLYYS